MNYDSKGLAISTNQKNNNLVFEDNRLVPDLYGEQNTNLHQIETAFDVQIVSRGNEIAIDGKSNDVASARAILETLWSKLINGEDVDRYTVDTLIRFSEAQKSGDAPKKSDQNGQHPKSQIRTKKKIIIPRTPVQADYINAMKSYNMVFGIGPAGTGKTYLAVANAVQMLEEGKIERIILSRPAIEAGERLGFLPGEMKEKMDPYMRPLYDSLQDTMVIEKVQKKLASEEIEIAPLAYMRGRTLNNACVILDEAQNATTQQMLMFLTRLGEHSRMVITGDPSQVDLPSGTKSGLMQARDYLSDEKDIGFIAFTAKDVIRNKLVAKVIQAYDRHREKHK